MIRKHGARTLSIVVIGGWILLGGNGAIMKMKETPAGNPGDQESRTAFDTADADPVLIAAGDVADCISAGAAATADLVAGIDGTVALLGDGAYGRGTSQEYAECYDPTWGAFKERTRPAPGNHDYLSPDAEGYFGYFGAAAGRPAEGWYSYDLGPWHVIVLNSNCDVVGCTDGSPQIDWLRADLAANPTRCTLAYWHHPRFSSGSEYGGDEDLAAIWEVLYDAGADIVLSGHEHDYERFAPQNPAGVADPERGIRAFVVGTGGRGHYGFDDAAPTSEVRDGNTLGVLALTLHPTGYDWAFSPVVGGSFHDEGSGACHA